jgi:hypothetical protein
MTRAGICEGNSIVKNYISAMSCILGYSNITKNLNSLSLLKKKAFRIFNLDEK